MNIVYIKITDFALWIRFYVKIFLGVETTLKLD